MKTIIVPLDFSPVSLNATNYAADMAMNIQAELMLVNTYNIPLAYESNVPLMLVSVDELRKQSENRLDELKKGIEHVTSGKIIVHTVTKLGNTVDELEVLCREVHPFAVVMGTKGKSEIEKMVFGSTTLQAIRHLDVPVICVPPGREFGKGIRKIGFACDFRHVAETIPAQLIQNIVREFKSELHILNVDYMEKHFRPDTPQESRMLHEMFRGLEPQYHYINNPDVEDGIHEFAETNNLDLLITIPKKHKFLESLFKSHSTKQLIYHSHVPVLCVHE